MRLRPAFAAPVILVMAFVLCICAPIAQAQALSLIGGSDRGKDANELDVEELITRATESGLGVIVIDAQGNVLSPAPGSDATPTPGGAGDGGMSLMKTQEGFVDFRAALFDRLRTLPQAAERVVQVLRDSSPDGTIFAYFKVLVFSLLLFGAGMVAERQIYGKRIARGFITSRIRETPQGYAEKMPFLTVRFVGGVIGTLFSMLVAYILGTIIFGPLEDPALQYTVTLINIGYFAARFVALAWRMILSPYLAQYRIPRLSDADARRLHLWLCTVVTAGIFSVLLNEWVRELGLDSEVFVFLAILSSFVVLLLNLLLVAVNRKAISGALLNGKPVTEVTWLSRLLARGWLPLVVLYLLFGWGELAFDLVLGDPPGVSLIAGAYLVLTVILVVYGAINYMIERGFARARAMRAVNAEAEGEADMAATEEAVPDAVLAARNQLTTFEELARRVAGIVAFVAGIYAFVRMWQPDTGMMTESLPSRTLDILVIMFIGYVIYQAFRIWIDQKIREEQGDEEPAELGDEGGGSSASRLATLLPLFRNVVLIVIVVSVLLIVLMELGVNVGPLFAGAGIVGVAVGFGSQSLVRDIFSGAFFLFDDAFRKGEYVEIGDVRGTVENISVRSFQLRHHLGKLHTIPFGEIQVLTNYSRDWVMMKLPLRVTYDTDVERVRKLIKKLGQQLLEDPVIGEDFIQPLKSQGVIEMQDSAMIIRVKFMTKPGDQWAIRKRVFQEIRDLFEREGINFAHREVTVRLAGEGDPARLSPAEKEAVMAAAEASIEEDILDAQADTGDDR